MTVCELPYTAAIPFCNPPAIIAPYREQPSRFSYSNDLKSWPVGSPSVKYVLQIEGTNFDTRHALNQNHVAAFFDEMQMENAAIEEVSKQWKRYLLDPNASADVDALSETVEGVFDAVSRFGPKAVNLKTLDSNNVQGEHLAAILRATASWQHETPGWEQALEVARAALLSGGIDPEDALYGLS